MVNIFLGLNHLIFVCWYIYVFDLFHKFLVIWWMYSFELVNICRLPVIPRPFCQQSFLSFHPLHFSGQSAWTCVLKVGKKKG